MIITNKTTIKDVEGCPFIGITDMPIFLHGEIDQVSVFDPDSFNEITKVIMTTKPIQTDVFRGNYRDLVQTTQGKGGMVYFKPTQDGKIVHKDSKGEYVRMAQVKLTNYHFNEKVRESVRKVNEPEIIKTKQKNYKYLLIR